MATSKRQLPMPSVAEVLAARAKFESVEPRGLFYRAARELVTLTREGKTKLGLGESLAVLLQTWNITFYRFTKKFDAAHFDELDQALAATENKLERLKRRTIDEISEEDSALVKDVFREYEKVL